MSLFCSVSQRHEKDPVADFQVTKTSATSVCLISLHLIWSDTQQPGCWYVDFIALRQSQAKCLTISNIEVVPYNYYTDAKNSISSGTIPIHLSMSMSSQGLNQKKIHNYLNTKFIQTILITVILSNGGLDVCSLFRRGYTA